MAVDYAKLEAARKRALESGEEEPSWLPPVEVVNWLGPDCAILYRPPTREEILRCDHKWFIGCRNMGR